MTEKKYDIVLFGVTGFTGKLCVEYLMEQSYDIKWAACARNEKKASKVLEDIVGKNPTKFKKPPLEIADLVCETSQQEETLRKIVASTKVCLTCSGPFEKYGQTLVKLCAELGVCYGDITGETDFVRKMVSQHDKKAQETGAVILSHCGNDCVPQDLIVYEMNRLAQQKGYELTKAMTYAEHAGDASFSGGTIATAAFQLGKDRKTMTKAEFDPMLTSVEGKKSDYSTKNISPKTPVQVPGVKGKQAESWFMGPVFVSCVRRSNALLGYSKDFQYGDTFVSEASWGAWFHKMAITAKIGAATLLPDVFGAFVPQPGEGPDRETMEAGHLILHARGSAIVPGGDVGGDADHKKTMTIAAKFEFNKDVAYLYTAALLVEVGMVLKDKAGYIAGGVKTPASALGSDLTQRLLEKLDCSLEVSEVPDESF